jgi:phage gpG-like protein
MRLFKLIGPLGKLDKLARQIGADRCKRFLSSLGNALALEALALTREGFDAGTDPSGRPWKRLKDKRARTRKPLNRSGALKRSYQTVALARSVKIFSNDPVAGYHQRGTAHLPARRQLPSARLPLRWKDRLSPLAVIELQKLIKGET